MACSKIPLKTEKQIKNENWTDAISSHSYSHRVNKGNLKHQTLARALILHYNVSEFRFPWRFISHHEIIRVVFVAVDIVWVEKLKNIIRLSYRLRFLNILAQFHRNDYIAHGIACIDIKQTRHSHRWSSINQPKVVVSIQTNSKFSVRWHDKTFNKCWEQLNGNFVFFFACLYVCVCVCAAVTAYIFTASGLGELKFNCVWFVWRLFVSPWKLHYCTACTHTCKYKIRSQCTECWYFNIILSVWLSVCV